MGNLYDLRNEDLGELATVLNPFIQAYRPHSKPKTWREYKKEGIKKMDPETVVDVIYDQWEEQQDWVDD